MEMAFRVLERNGHCFALCLHTRYPVPQSEWDAVMLELGRGGTNLGNALAHLELAEELSNLWQEWMAIQKQLPPNRALRLIATERALPWSGPEPDLKLPSQYP